MRVLVTGGAGYVGSIVCEALVSAGHEVVAYDNLSHGHITAVIEGVPLLQADLLDGETLSNALSSYGIEAVIHMAANCFAGESFADPSSYYRNNLSAGLSLLDAMIRRNVKRVVFSSSTTVYGDPGGCPVDESQATVPASPYGETKLAFERALHWYERSYQVRYAALRYFGAAGASRHCGESHEPESHLIPLVLQTAMGKRRAVEIFGDDYPTADGTCVRDFLHVEDVARAHVLALEALDRHSEVYNLGRDGEGYSVRQVIETAREATGYEIAAVTSPRRAGDPATVLASAEKIFRELGWKAERGLRDILLSAWSWMQEHPNGYEAYGSWAKSLKTMNADW
jgi:UDP-glucose 4-epimerase